MTEAIVQLDDREFREALLDLLDLTGDLTPVMKDIGHRLLLGTHKRFRNEEDPDGRPWRRLSARYERRKKRGGKILTLSGRLKRSITMKAGDDYTAVGTNAIYARAHQKGAVIKIPARSQANAREGGRFISHRQAGRRRRKNADGTYSDISVVAVSFSRHKERRIILWPRPFLGEGCDRYRSGE